MISFEEYREIVFELMEELPDEFFRELSGGVITSEGVSVPDYAQGNDLWILGKYQVFSRVRQITMYIIFLKCAGSRRSFPASKLWIT